MTTQHPLLCLPPELRLTIYNAALGPTKSRPLYLTRHIYTWKSTSLKHLKSRHCHALLLVCRHMYQDVQELLYDRHEVQLYTTSPRTIAANDSVRKRVCGVEGYRDVFLRVQRLRVKVFVGGAGEDENALLALMGYLKAVLAERVVPLKALHVEMCAVDLKDRGGGRTAMLYAAQGLRSFGLTTFQFHGGFSGVGSEDAMEALMAHARKEERMGRPEVSEEKALERLEKAWADAQPMWYDPRAISCEWLRERLNGIK